MTEKAKRRITLGIIATVLLLVLIVVFVICRAIYLHSALKEKLEDFNIDTLTDEYVVDNVMSTSLLSSHKHTGGNSGNFDTLANKSADYDKVYFSCKEITGIDVVSATMLNDERVSLNITSKISSGKGKIAIIQDGVVVEYIEFGESAVRTYEATGYSEIIVKILCESAEIEITVTRDIKG